MTETAGTFSIENILYLRSYLGEDAVEDYFRVTNNVAYSEKEEKNYKTVLDCLNEMQKYGDNHWWESHEQREIGYYQLRCPILLVEFKEFVNALSHLLKRPVFDAELGCSAESLLNESERAFHENQGE